MGGGLNTYPHHRGNKPPEHRGHPNKAPGSDPFPPGSAVLLSGRETGLGPRAATGGRPGMSLGQSVSGSLTRKTVE